MEPSPYLTIFLALVSGQELPLSLEELEQYPLVSRTERESEVCEGIKEIVEIRDVDGEEIGTVKSVYQPTLYAVLEESKTKGHTEVWHRFITFFTYQEPLQELVTDHT